MRRCLGWTLLAVLVVSLLAAPAASARPDRGDAPAGPAGWMSAVVGWLSALVPGGPTAIAASDDIGGSIDPNGLLPGTTPAADEDGARDAGAAGVSRD